MSNDLRNRKITIFKNIDDVSNPHHKSLEHLLERIQSGASQKLVQDVRAAKKDVERAEAKAKLPAVLFSGKFSNPQENKHGKTTYRVKESLHQHSGLVVLDYDKIQPEAIMDELCADNYVLAAWVSPSGNGVKALVQIDDPDRHVAHYNAIISEFSKYGDLDTSSRNVNRVTYESWDENIYINWNAWVFSKVLEEPKKKEQSDVKGIIHDHNYSKLKVPKAMIHNAPIGARNNTLVKAATLAGGYIQSGYVPRTVFEEVLFVEYQQVNPDEDEQDIWRAIANGINHGLTMPIFDFEREEKAAIDKYGESPIDFLEDTDSASLKLYRWYLGEREENWSVGWKELDNYMPWKRPQLHVHMGHDNVGKTFTATFFMVQAAIMHGWPATILAIENQTDKMIRDIMSFAAGKPVMSMSQQEFSFYNDFAVSYFDFITPASYTVDQTLSMLDEVQQRKSIKNVMIDPYNSLAKTGTSVYAHDTDAAAKIMLYSHTRNVNIWLNVHTTTGARRQYYEEGHEYAGLLKKPNKGDVEMGAVWQNKADYLSIGHRFINHPDATERATTLISVEKVKDSETGGSIHPHGEDFSIRLKGGTFVDAATGEKAFTPLPFPNRKEI